MAALLLCAAGAVEFGSVCAFDSDGNQDDDAKSDTKANRFDQSGRTQWCRDGSENQVLAAFTSSREEWRLPFERVSPEPRWRSARPFPSDEGLRLKTPCRTLQEHNLRVRSVHGSIGIRCAFTVCDTTELVEISEEDLGLGEHGKALDLNFLEGLHKNVF